MGRVEIDDVAKVDFARLELLPPDGDGLEGERALAEPREHGLAADIDAFGNGHLARTRKQVPLSSYRGDTCA